MKYSLSLSVKFSNELNELFNSFDEKTDRVKVKILRKKDQLFFNIEANDSVALRSVLNSITKLFTVYEKLSSIDELKGN